MREKKRATKIGTRSSRAVLNAEQEFHDKVWYGRHMDLNEKRGAGRTTVDPEIWATARAAAEKLRKKYGIQNLGPWTDFEWGMLNGKLSTLRWILGSEWDNLDT